MWLCFPFFCSSFSFKAIPNTKPLTIELRCPLKYINFVPFKYKMEWEWEWGWKGREEKRRVLFGQVQLSLYKQSNRVIIVIIVIPIREDSRKDVKDNNNNTLQPYHVGKCTLRWRKRRMQPLPQSGDFPLIFHVLLWAFRKSRVSSWLKGDF